MISMFIGLAAFLFVMAYYILKGNGKSWGFFLVPVCWAIIPCVAAISGI